MQIEPIQYICVSMCRDRAPESRGKAFRAPTERNGWRERERESERTFPIHFPSFALYAGPFEWPFFFSLSVPPTNTHTYTPSPTLDAFSKWGSAAEWRENATSPRVAVDRALFCIDFVGHRRYSYLPRPSFHHATNPGVPCARSLRRIAKIKGRRKRGKSIWSHSHAHGCFGEHRPQLETLDKHLHISMTSFALVNCATLRLWRLGGKVQL